MIHQIAEQARLAAKLPPIGRKGLETANGRITQKQFSDFVYQVSKVLERKSVELMKLQIQLEEALAVNDKNARHIERLEHYRKHPASGVNWAGGQRKNRFA
ncbi:hypothetical protein N9Z53_01530 [Mariniblastus sp.]|nr:hypothetical protein [Mariniblastus sp.]